MHEEIFTFFKTAYKASRNPVLWVVNICGLIIGAWYWSAVDSASPGLATAFVVCFCFVLMIVCSAFIFWRDDKEVRLYHESLNTNKDKDKKPKVLKSADVKALQDTPVKSYLYAKYSLAKYTSGLTLAIIWALLSGALLISSPCNCDGGASYYPATAVPAIFFILSLVVLLVTAVMKQTYTEQLTGHWFSILNPPTKKVPRGFEPGVVLCKSPTPLKNWADEDTYKCEISEIDGNKMPKGDKRQDILWRYIPLENTP